MEFLPWALTNGLLLIPNITTNAFYIFCMVCPLHGERIKQPLKLLLATLICSTIVYLMSSSLMFFSALRHGNSFLTRFSLVVSVSNLSTSMSASVWLNFFYFTQIVPAQRALFVLIKRNIKPIIFYIWIIEFFFSSLHSILEIIDVIPSHSFGSNSTVIVVDGMSQTAFFISLTSILKAHFFFCVCVMVMSSGTTVVYLCRHMRRMVANGQPFSCPRFSSQVRVTVTGILQGVMYVLCSAWLTYAYASNLNESSVSNAFTDLIAINVYMTVTTFNLGAGQAVFRQRAAGIWTRAAQRCRPPEYSSQSKEPDSEGQT